VRCVRFEIDETSEASYRLFRSDLKRWEREVSEASAGAYRPVARKDVAAAVAPVAGLHRPTRPETVELLSELIETIQTCGVVNGRSVDWVGGLQDIGWPSDPRENLVTHVVAAADLGLFDPEDTITVGREQLLRGRDENEGSAIAEATPMRMWEPAPTEPRSPYDQFLLDWETLLGAIVDVIVYALIRQGDSGSRARAT
jgi:hypothetical protein